MNSTKVKDIRKEWGGAVAKRSKALQLRDKLKNQEITGSPTGLANL